MPIIFVELNRSLDYTDYTDGCSTEVREQKRVTIMNLVNVLCSEFRRYKERCQTISCLNIWRE